MSMYVSMYMYMYMYMYIRHVHVHQPHPGCLLLPVHTYFKIKAADSKLFIKGADGSTRIDVRAAKRATNGVRISQCSQVSVSWYTYSVS